MIINYDQKINCTEVEKGSVRLSGPLGNVKVYLGYSYIRSGEHYIEINQKYITKQNIRLLRHLNNGLTVGYRKTIYQSGIWTLMKKVSPVSQSAIKGKIKHTLSFKLGFSHLSLFKVPDDVLFRSKRNGQFRTINIYSISYQLVADTAARLIRLRKADVYRLNGFRYKGSSNVLKIGKKK